MDDRRCLAKEVGPPVRAGLLAQDHKVWRKRLMDNYPNCYDVIWESPSDNALGAMPVGGLDLGALVWVEGQDLLVYVDVFCTATLIYSMRF